VFQRFLEEVQGETVTTEEQVPLCTCT
jgi:hypothetical protein